SIVGVDTEPQGANVEIRDRKGMMVYHGRTPATLRLKHSSGFFRKATYQVKLSMEGYLPKTIVVDSHLNAWYFGNVVGIVGFLIFDPVTGAMYKLDNTEVDEKLAPQGSGAAFDPGSGATTLRIVALKDVPDERRKDLVRLP
ncbi:MAG TPA: PEGA domain-containing protein, partial [Puia sp.]|nr:PEGA domain-containing protein [Puia sp.]